MGIAMHNQMFSVHLAKKTRSRERGLRQMKVTFFFLGFKRKLNRNRNCLRKFDVCVFFIFYFLQSPGREHSQGPFGQQDFLILSIKEKKMLQTDLEQADCFISHKLCQSSRDPQKAKLFPPSANT